MKHSTEGRCVEIATLIGKLKVGSRLYSLYSQKVKESLDTLSLLVGGVRVYPSYEEGAKAGELSFKLGNKVWHLREAAPAESEHHNGETWEVIPNNETKHFSNETIYLKLLDRVAKVNFIGTGDVFIDVVEQGDPDAGENIYHFYLTKHDDIDVAVEFPNLTITIGIVGLEALIMKEYSGPLVGEVTLNLS
nr:MAG TPA: hypothetical protein [Bacteriophage sp.]